MPKKKLNRDDIDQKLIEQIRTLANVDNAIREFYAYETDLYQQQKGFLEADTDLTPDQKINLGDTLADNYDLRVEISKDPTFKEAIEDNFINGFISESSSVTELKSNIKIASVINMITKVSLSASDYMNDVIALYTAEKTEQDVVQ